MNDFNRYLLSFYGPQGLYAMLPPMTELEAIVSCKCVRRRPTFEGDSFDRELTRDVCLKMRNPATKTEYVVDELLPVKL